MTGAPALSRSSREVRHARLKIAAGAPRHKLIFGIEEALRLSALPGENEGRVYYFRYLRVAGLPEDGDRHLWLTAFQRALTEKAQGAINGRNAEAANFEVVYFDSEQEACLALLTSVSEKRNLDAWFWPAISGSASNSSTEAHVLAVIEKLSLSPSGWLAVATAVFAVQDFAPLLLLLGQEQVEAWLLEMGDRAAQSLFQPWVILPSCTSSTLRRAKAMLGRDDPRVLWLVSLAVIMASPVEIEKRRAVAIARALLFTQSLSGSVQQPLSTRRGVSFDSDPDRIRSQNHPIEEAEPEELRLMREAAADAGLQDAASGHGSSSEVFSPDAIDSGQNQSPSDRFRAEIAADGINNPAEAQSPDPVSEHAVTVLNERTQGAGLYFLLNALTHLGIAEQEVSVTFLAHLFQLVAKRAGIGDDDPILGWTWQTLEESGPHPIDLYQLRRWAWRLRRWCWRNARIPLDQVVSRQGWVTLTRTDLDVSFSLDSVDIRIRRAGLDLDPGWVPWFGRVVRFHYRDRGEFS